MFGVVLVIRSTEIPSLCEELYGSDWLTQFKRLGTVGINLLVGPLIAHCGLAEASRILPLIMTHLRQECRGESIRLPTPVLTPLKRPPARFNEKVSEGLRKLGELERCFLNTLLTVDSLDFDDVLAMILFSSVRFGACINANHLHALMMALRDKPKRYQQHYWFELEYESGSDRVWRPDPLTMVLLLTWYTKAFHRRWESELPLAPNAHRVLSNFFRKRGIWSRCGMPVTTLLDTVSAKLSLDVSPVLADCARGVIDNRTLLPVAFRRYITGKTPRIYLSDSDKFALEKKPKKRLYNAAVAKTLGQGESQAETRFWVQVRKILRVEKKRPVAREQITEHLKANELMLSQISRLLAEWVNHLLTTRNQWGNKLKPSSIGSELTSILNGLRSSVGDSECLAFLGSEWGEIYLQLLDAKETLGSRRTAQQNLAEFHRFLTDKYGANETDGVSLAVSNRRDRLPHVDAKIILEAEYQAAYRYFQDRVFLTKSRVSRELATSQLIALILGFRCGLRRSEVYWLKIDDIRLGSQAEILLAGKRAVTLKTNAANRRVPIYLLMRRQELDVFQNWVHWRLNLAATADSFAFETQDPRRLLIDENDLFDPIQSVLQVITGDCNARFHHLRHSFGTHTFKAWVSPDSAEPSAQEWVYRQRREILHARSGNAESKKAAKALHVMIGHAGIDMSMTHYVHSAEWVLFERLPSISPRLSSSVMSRLTGLTERHIQRLSADSAASAVVVQGHVRKKLSGITPEIDVSDWCKPGEKRIQIQARKIFREREWILDLWRALSIYQNRGAPIDELAARFNISPEKIKRSLARSEKIFNMKYGTGGHNYYRHRPASWDESAPAPVIFDFPAKKKDFQSALKLVRRFEELPDRKKAIARWAVQYFLHHGSSKKAYILFRDKPSLKRFVRALEIFDVNAVSRPGSNVTSIPRFRLKLVLPSSQGPEQRQAAWDYWGRGLSLKPYQMRDEVGGVRGKMGRVELSIIGYKSVSPPKANVMRRKSRPSDWGVRLGLYLIAIALGWRQESEFEQS